MNALRAALAVVVALAVFQNSLHGGFVIDDGSAIRTNQDLRPDFAIALARILVIVPLRA